MAVCRTIASRVLLKRSPRFIEKVTLNNRRAQAAPKPRLRNTDVDLVDGLKLGQQVAHPKFGRGVIIGYDGAAKTCGSMSTLKAMSAA